MKELIRYIRAQARMSQEQFAAALGTQPLSINRWENGKATPNQMAQRQILQFCRDRGINTFDKIVEGVTEHECGTSNLLVLYHGSKKGITGDIAPVSRAACDFGKGFYMGTDPSQPLTLICDEKHPIIYTVELDLNGLNVLNIDMGLEWAMLIAYYRGYMKEIEGTEFYEHYAHLADGYDIIQGFIANDRMYRVMTDFFDKTITDIALINCLKALDLGEQYVALTAKACKNIRIIREKKLSLLELAIIKERSETRRSEGMSLADDVILNFRRTGRYFDEIIKGGIL